MSKVKLSTDLKQSLQHNLTKILVARLKHENLPWDRHIRLSNYRTDFVWMTHLNSHCIYIRGDLPAAMMVSCIESAVNVIRRLHCQTN